MRSSISVLVIVMFFVAGLCAFGVSQSAQAEAGDCINNICTPNVDLYVSSVTAISSSSERLVITLVDGNGASYNVCNGAGAPYPAELIVPCTDKEHDAYLDMAKASLISGKPLRVRAKANLAFFGFGSNACQLFSLTLHQRL